MYPVFTALDQKWIGMGGGYNWTWPQIPSLTAMKYQRHGYVQVIRTKKGFLKKLKSQARPFLPGERFSGRKGCEQNVKVITILTLLSHHHIDTIIIT